MYVPTAGYGLSFAEQEDKAAGLQLDLSHARKQLEEVHAALAHSNDGALAESARTRRRVTDWRRGQSEGPGKPSKGQKE